MLQFFPQGHTKLKSIVGLDLETPPPHAEIEMNMESDDEVLGA
jgi:hypothetical protein